MQGGECHFVCESNGMPMADDAEGIPELVNGVWVLLEVV